MFKYAVLVSAICLSAQAQQLSVPLCNSSEARLSLEPKNCIGDQVINFDIPAIKLQLEDIRKILQGAESSGGRLAPNTQDRPIGTANILLPTHECQARLLLDGGVRVSWLLTSEFEVTEEVASLLPANIWRSGLVVGNDINGTQHQVDELPAWGLSNLSVKVGEEGLTVCAESSCSTSDLTSSSTLSLFNSQATLKLKVSCQEL